MKNIKAKMMGFIAMAIVVATSNAKTVIIENQTIYPVNIETNESVIILSDYFSIPYVEKDGITNYVGIAGSASSVEPYIVTGPIKLFFEPSLLTYRKITNSPFKTMFVRCGQTNSINVESNKTVRFFDDHGANGVGSRITLLIDDGNVNEQFDSVFTYGTEYDGPINFRFDFYSYNPGCRCLLQTTNCSDQGDQCPYTNHCPYTSLDGYGEFCFVTNSVCREYKYTKAYIVNYYIIDEFLSTPANGYVETSPGSLTLAVEKSINLTNWFPVFINSTGDDQYAFYRLKLTRKSNYGGGGASLIMNGGPNGISYFEGMTNSFPPVPWNIP